VIFHPIKATRSDISGEMILKRQKGACRKVGLEHILDGFDSFFGVFHGA
jgi:hypothetical protein